MKYRIAWAALSAISASLCYAAHPEVLVTQADQDAVLQKLQSVDWAKDAYQEMRAELDPIVRKTESDPMYAASRLFMNWDTHWTTPLVEKSASAGGEGHAPIPTPRFAGARNWASDYARPADFDAWKPFNDQHGKVYLKNNRTGQMEWVDPALTGRNFEIGNEQVMGMAANAAFIYWLSGDEAYARFAKTILLTYMNGFALMQPPKAVTPDRKMMGIIGSTSFEVIHESLLVKVALAYDFLQPYLAANHIDTAPIEAGMQRWAQRITDGGNPNGNWNLNQAVMITYAGLALGDDAHYANHLGRQHFIDIVLNARLPHQTGLTHVIDEGFDKQSKLWPEAAGYGFGAAGQMVELAYLLSADPAGAKVLQNPLLAESIQAERQLIYPNGLSIGVGDTTSVRMNAGALELLIARARRTGDAALEDRLTALLDQEINSGHYSRSARADLFALTQFVGTLKTPESAAPPPDRTFWFGGMNILTQHNGSADPKHALAAALYGTEGGHVHANGMAIELYGAGYILGADPGRGASYWTPDQHGYYATPPAHNTVIINGSSIYNENKSPDRQMKTVAVEPAPGTAALSPNVSFAVGEFHYAKPAADQQRTLAVVRTSDRGGLYFDVFRSRTTAPGASFHDYLYHNMGQSVSFTRLDGGSETLRPTSTLADQPNLLKGYTYFKNERSAKLDGPLHATFQMKAPDRTVDMALWMPGAAERTLFAVEAPKNNAIRDAIAAPLRDIPMPTVIVRQAGQAWKDPFVAIYEPYGEADGPVVTAVQSLRAADNAPGLAAVQVQTRAGPLTLLQDDAPADRQVCGIHFNGTFAAVFGEADRPSEIYLGLGHSIAVGDIRLSASTEAPISADLRREGDAWILGCTRAMKVTLPIVGTIRSGKLFNGQQLVADAIWQAGSGAAPGHVTFTLPAGGSQRITLRANDDRARN